METDGKDVEELRGAVRGGERLRRMVHLRIDPRLRPRFDASDVIQEAFVEAARRIHAYIENPTIPFYPWLRHLAVEKLIQLQRRHLTARKRDARREVVVAPDCSASSSVMADEFMAPGKTPSESAVQRELKERLLAILEQMEPADRDILAMRHFEELTNAETALILGISASAARMRHFRALGRLRELMDHVPGWRPRGD
jgi:RNA polymerase sigma-70 factor (ECF subfamily)